MVFRLQRLRVVIKMNTNKWHIDFETRSMIDLRKAGVHVYSKHIFTDALCMAYAKNDLDVELWKLNDEMPYSLLEAVEKGESIYAHNAAFEYQIWNNVCVPKYGWPKLKLEQLHCTMAQAYYMALPGSLEHAAPSLGIAIKKDMPGHRVMLQLSQPRGFNEDGSPIWWAPEHAKNTKEYEILTGKFETLYSYCKNDIEVERELCKRTLPLPRNERRLWLLDQKINLRGVAIDKVGVQAGMKLLDFEKNYLNDEMKRVTNNAVATCQSVSQLKVWLEEFGLVVPSLAKQEVSELIDQIDLPEVCREALILRRQAAKSSTAKLDAMINGISPDGRLRGMFQYYGAYATGRWAARRVQLHNLPRGKMKPREVEMCIDLMGQVN